MKRVIFYRKGRGERREKTYKGKKPQNFSSIFLQPLRTQRALR